MSDLPAMRKCKRDPKGRHHLGAVIPGDDNGDITLFCEACGAVRRMPATGDISLPLDDLTAEEIARLVG